MKREIPAEFLLPSDRSLPQKHKTAVTRLAPEQRGERQFVRVPIPFVIEYAGQEIVGRDLSLDGFALDEPLVEAGVDTPFNCRLRMMFKGYELTFQIEAVGVADEHTGPAGTYRIAQMDEAQREVLRKTIRAFLSGQLITFEGLLLPADAQTERQRRKTEDETDVEESDELEMPPWHRYIRYSAIGLGACVLFGFLLTSIFQRIAITESRFAALTAPRVDIRAPASGHLNSHNMLAGMMVSRDQNLSQIIDAELDADLALAEAERNRLAIRMRANTEGEDAGLVERVIASPRGGLGISLGQLRSVSDATFKNAALSSLHAEFEMSEIRVAALRHRGQANHLLSPCECEISWAVPNGEWVERGERVFSLIRTAANMMTVEALVHMSEINGIEPHEEAYLELPVTGELVAARVLAVRLDTDRGPRTGFPKWVSQDQSLASVELIPSEPLPSSLVGIPMRVFFTSWPEMTRFAGGA